jgi:hypothetical protein
VVHDIPLLLLAVCALFVVAVLGEAQLLHQLLLLLRASTGIAAITHHLQLLLLLLQPRGLLRV